MHWLKVRWRRFPHHIRKPVVLTLGIVIIICAGLIGWLPGPGGLPLFLLGITLLATEFHWAEHIRDGILGLLKRTMRWIRSHPRTSSIIILAILLAWLAPIFIIFFGD